MHEIPHYCRFSSETPQKSSFLLLNIIEDINIISAKLLFKNTCSYVNVYLRVTSSQTNIHFILIIDFMLYSHFIRNVVWQIRLNRKRLKKVIKI
ncbi:hypothetical protein BGV40_04265 [Methanosarcina sp. Ant1]|nr:hypothetical protein BGV40_04265 [Methanosarcina sp. Ant1]